MANVICVDGPAASGKSTVSKLIAKRIGYTYVDSGALYRIVTWQALEAGVDMSNADKIAAFASTIKVDFQIKDFRVVYIVNGEEPGDRIRTPEINRHVSPVSVIPEVRTIVTNRLRDMQKIGNIIVEGRDIGSVVYPNSPLKFYLDADADERSRRRHVEDQSKGFSDKQSQSDVKNSLLNRDKIDSSRKTAPLKIPDGALVIDTTNMTIDEVVEKIITAI